MESQITVTQLFTPQVSCSLRWAPGTLGTRPGAAGDDAPPRDSPAVVEDSASLRLWVTSSFSCRARWVCASHSSSSFSKRWLSSSTKSLKSGGNVSIPTRACPVSLLNSSANHSSETRTKVRPKGDAKAQNRMHFRWDSKGGFLSLSKSASPKNDDSSKRSEKKGCKCLVNQHHNDLSSPV